MEKIKKCTVCGNDFTGKSNKAKYCSDACKLVAFRKREKMRTEDETRYEEIEKRNDLEVLKEKYTTFEQNQKNLQQELIKNQIFIAKNFVSTDEIRELSEEIKENYASIKELRIILEALISENKELKDQLYKLNFNFEDIKRDFILLKENKNGTSNDTNNDVDSIIQKLAGNEKLVEKMAQLISKL